MSRAPRGVGGISRRSADSDPISLPLAALSSHPLPLASTAHCGDRGQRITSDLDDTAPGSAPAVKTLGGFPPRAQSVPALHHRPQARGTRERFLGNSSLVCAQLGDRHYSLRRSQGSACREVRLTGDAATTRAGPHGGAGDPSPCTVSGVHGAPGIRRQNGRTTRWERAGQ